MPGIVRDGDKSVGHCFSPVAPIPGNLSKKTLINGKPICRVTNPYPTHCCGPSCHGNQNVEKDKGSKKLIVEGLLVVRSNDPINCGDKTGACSPNTINNY